MKKFLAFTFGVLVFLFIGALAFYTYITTNRDANFAMLSGYEAFSIPNGSLTERYPFWVRNQHVLNGDYYFSQQNYDADRAYDSYRGALAIDIDENAMYSFARVAMASEQPTIRQEAAAIAKDFELFFPDNKRIHYVQGLVNGYLRNFDEAELAFEKFIKAYDDEWQGYLDLSWIHFQKGEFEQSKGILEQGLELDANNPWLNSSYAVVLNALRNSDNVTNTAVDPVADDTSSTTVLTSFNNSRNPEYYAQLAVDQGKLIDENIWRLQYSGNDPKEDSHQIEHFNDVLQYNLLLVSGDDQVVNDENLIQKTAESQVADLSPLGLQGGYHLSACGSSCPTYSQLWRADSGWDTPVRNIGGTCNAVKNVSGGDIAVPNKTSGEWAQFFNKKPAGVTVPYLTPPCQTHYGTPSCHGGILARKRNSGPISCPSGYTYDPSRLSYGSAFQCIDSNGCSPGYTYDTASAQCLDANGNPLCGPGTYADPDTGQCLPIGNIK